MDIYVYVSDKSGQTIVTREHHGLKWELGNDVFDMMSHHKMDDVSDFIVLDTRASSAVKACAEDFIE